MLAQSPMAPATLPAGAAVTLVLSDGSLVRVPRVANLNINEARQRLQKDLDLKAQPVVVTSELRVGTVIEQQPAEGTLVKRGSVVRLQVSAGQEGPEVIDVPSVVGMPFDQAKSRLNRFSVQRVERPRTERSSAAGRPGGRAVTARRIARGSGFGDRAYGLERATWDRRNIRDAERRRARLHRCRALAGRIQGEPQRDRQRRSARTHRCAVAGSGRDAVARRRCFTADIRGGTASTAAAAVQSSAASNATCSRFGTGKTGDVARRLSRRDRDWRRDRVGAYFRRAVDAPLGPAAARGRSSRRSDRCDVAGATGHHER